MKQTVETRLRRRLTNLARRQRVTVDDAGDLLVVMGFEPELATIRSVLAEPTFTPVGWKQTDKASRHGRPVRTWRTA